MAKLLVILACLGLSLTQKVASQTVQNNFLVVTKGPIDLWHPYARLKGEQNYAQYMVNRPLLVADGSWQWQCYLCKEIPSKADGSIKLVRQGKQVFFETEWELKPDLHWGDGTPITGHDVVFTFEVAKKIAHEQGVQHFTHTIDLIRVDERNVRKFTIRYFGIYAEFFQMDGFFLLPKHLEESIWLESAEDTQEYLQKSHYSTTPTNPGLYDGPYVLDKIQNSASATLVTNKKFSLGKTKEQIPLIKVMSVPNSKEIAYLISQGRPNIIAEASINYLDMIDLQKKNKSPEAKNRFNYYYQDNSVFEHIGINLRNPVLADANVRKALIIATDRKGLVDELFNGGKNAAHANISPNDRFYNGNIKTYDYSPKTANRLLEISDWKRVKDQKYRSKEEKPLTLELTIPEGQPLRLKTAQILQKQWEEVGVELKIEAVEEGDFYPKAVAKAQFRDLILFAWNSSSDRLLRATLHSKEIPSFENRYSGQNISAWRNKNVDGFLDKLTREFDHGKRKEYVHDIVMRYLEDVPEIPLYFDTNAALTSPNVQNFRLSGNDLPSSFWAETWRL